MVFEPPTHPPPPPHPAPTLGGLNAKKGRCAPILTEPRRHLALIPGGISAKKGRHVLAPLNPGGPIRNV